MAKTSVRTLQQFNAKSLGLEGSILIYDKRLVKVPSAQKIIKQFPNRYGVVAGERLKDLKSFPQHVDNLLKIISKQNHKNLKVVSLGGGSVGDFAGFFASVFKRGLDIVHIPSTWLAAIDSSHGGKTGLNASGHKNQIGTFHSAQAVYLVKPLLLSQPSSRLLDAKGELYKIVLIEGRSLWKSLRRLSNITEKQIWTFLPKAILSKYKVVAQDPYEKNGYRQILNLGHTVGHVFEAALSVSHGEAVGQGLIFAILWGHRLQYLSDKSFNEIRGTAIFKDFENGFLNSLKRLREGDLKKHLLMDKKKSDRLDLFFIFPVRPGLCVRQKVTVQSLIETFKELKDEFSN